MGSGAVDNSYPQAGQENGVQGVGIAGAENVLHGFSRLLGPAGHLAHEGGLAAARTAFQDVEPAGPLRGQQVVVEGVKAGGGVGPQKILDVFFIRHRIIAVLSKSASDYAGLAASVKKRQEKSRPDKRLAGIYIFGWCIRRGERGFSYPTTLRAQRRNEVSHKVLCQAFFQESGVSGGWHPGPSPGQPGCSSHPHRPPRWSGSGRQRGAPG